MFKSQEELRTASIDQLLTLLKNTLPQDRYHNIEILQKAQTRVVFKAGWGTDGQRPVVIKVDTQPTSPRALRHCKRGFNNLNELEIGLSQNHKRIVEIRDYHTVNSPTNEQLGVITVENYLPQDTLQTSLQKKIFSGGEFFSLATQLLETADYLYKQGIFHRDLNSGNIYVTRGETLDIVVNDLVNATNIEDLKPKYLPTAGAKYLLDPLIVQEFTNEEGQYSVQSEIYAIGKTLLEAATGKKLFEFDPDSLASTNRLTNIPLLNEDLTINRKNYQRVLDLAIKSLPRRTRRKFGRTLNSMLTLDKESRFSSIEQCLKQFNVIETESLGSFFGDKIVLTGIIGILLVGGGLGIWEYNKAKEQMKILKKGRQDYKVEVYWEENSPEIKNNLAELVVKTRTESELFYTEKGVLTAEAGEGILVNISTEETLPQAYDDVVEPIRMLSGRAYIEGFQGTNFTTTVGTRRPEVYSRSFYATGLRLLEVDSSLADQVRMLVVELYAPNNKEKEGDWFAGKIIFEEPYKIISRKTIPLIVGSPTEQAQVKMFYPQKGGAFNKSYLELGLINSLWFDNTVSHKITRHYNGTSEILWSIEGIKGRRHDIFLETAKNYEQQILELSTFDQNNSLIYKTYFPVKVDSTTQQWNFAYPDTSLSRILMQIESNKHAK